MTFSQLLLLAVFAGLAAGQTTFFTSCPKLATLPGFTKAAFDGLWRVYASSPSSWEEGWTCKNITYNENNNGFSYAYQSSSGSKSAYTGTYDFPDEKEGVVYVSMTFLPTYTNRIVDGDLGSWAIVRSCTNLGLFITESTYALTRVMPASVEARKAIDAALTKQGIDKALLDPVDHSKC